MGAFSAFSLAQEYDQEDSQRDRARSEREARRDDRPLRERYQTEERQGTQRDRDLGELKSETERFIQRYDRNRDQELSRDELPRHMRENFQEIDRDQDDRLTAGELEQHARRMQRYTAMPVEVTYIWITGANRGRLDVDDVQQVYTLLREADQNSDGRLTQEELKRQRQKVASKCVHCVLESRDENEDGKLSRREARGTAVAYDFARIDRNSDGFASEDELQRAAQIDSREEEEDESGDSDSDSRENERE
jgi:Ca2+-binding EF-hand superfamily protein